MNETVDCVSQLPWQAGAVEAVGSTYGTLPSPQQTNVVVNANDEVHQ